MAEKILYTSWDSPCGTLMLASVDDKLIMSDWVNGWHHSSIMKRFDNLLGLPFLEKTSAVIERAIDELNEYFLGRRKEFDLPLELFGTAFQIQVWEALKEIGYGQTVSYADIARKISNPKAIRAVGGAVGLNPLSIIIPCHRVVGANQSLTGYGGGLEAKKYLLALETSRHS